MLGQPREPLGLSDLDREQILDLSFPFVMERKDAHQILSSFAIQLKVFCVFFSQFLLGQWFDNVKICLPGVGTFMAKNPAENPQHEYHFKWTTAFACPQPTAACSGVVGGISYSLQSLAAQVPSIQNVMDTNGNTYFYLPCGSLGQQMPQCTSVSPADDTPAMCQKDTR